MTTETIRVAADGLTIDQLVWRRYRRPIPGLVEQVLSMNPGLAQLGPFLPIGATVVLPVLAEATEPVVREIETLWD